MISVRRYETYVDVRFENISNRQVFDLKLDNLRASFPKAKWDEGNTQWLLDISYYEAVQE